MNKRKLRSLISKEIKRLSNSNDIKDTHLVLNVLEPMLVFIDNHDQIMSELVRIGSRHSL